MSIFDFFKSQKKQQGSHMFHYDPPEQHVRIIRDCLRIIDSTANPETYFYRYQLALTETDKIIDYTDAVYENMTARQLREKLINERDKRNRDFIDRIFDAEKEHLLVYQMAAAGPYLKYNDSSYFIERLKGRKFHFVRVCFDSESGKRYTYVTRDKSVEVGDIVFVPIGSGTQKQSEPVEVVSVFDASLNELTFPIVNLRCVERKYIAEAPEEQQYLYDLEGNWKGHPLYCPKEGQYLYDLEGNWKGDASYHADELQDYYSSDGGLEVKTAHVTQQTHILKQDEYICSNCGYKSLSPFTKCPSCKAQIIKSKYDPTWVDEMEMMDIFFGD